jgi:hypothetical protein
MCGPVRSPSGAVSGCALLAVLGAFASITLADTVILDNGDRITGRIQRAESGKVVIATDYAGEIRIDWAHIETLTSDEAMTVVSMTPRGVWQTRDAGQHHRCDFARRPFQRSCQSNGSGQAPQHAQDQLVTARQLNIGGSKTGNAGQPFISTATGRAPRSDPIPSVHCSIAPPTEARDTAERSCTRNTTDSSPKWYGTIYHLRARPLR